MTASDLITKYKSYVFGAAGCIYGVYLLTSGQADAGIGMIGACLGMMGLRFQWPETQAK